jgi:hypothetical protein
MAYTKATPALSVNDLQDQTRFSQTLQLSIKEIPAFVNEHYWLRRSRITYTHYLISLLTVAAFVFLLLSRGVAWSAGLAALGFGGLLFLILLPVHEAIHGLAYRALGASDIRYGFYLREGFAYAVANAFVVDRRQFILVIIAPFVVISLFLISLALVVPAWAAVLLSALMWHTAGTSGDCALLNYLWLHRDEEVYTYDDAQSRMSYFYTARSLVQQPEP